MTDLGSGKIVQLLSSNPFKISDSEKSLLLEIKNNPKVSSATIKKIDLALKPSTEVIQDPTNH